MSSYNCWTKHGERGVIMEEDEEGDDIIDDNYLDHFGDTFMEDAEGGEGEGKVKGKVKKRHVMSPLMILVGPLLMHEGETEKERENLDRMLEDHKKSLYPGCDNGLKKLGCTLDLLKWKAREGVAGFENLLKMLKNMFPKNNELPASTYEAKKVVCPLGLEVINPEDLPRQNDVVQCLVSFELVFPPSFFNIMTHLLVHLVEEISILGPVFLHNMFPFERFMGVLKKYVRNRARPEGSIAKGYGNEELYMLAKTPSSTITTFQGYEINGNTFYTIAQDKKSTNQNSGVRFDAATENGQKVTYYGYIEEIWELDYGPSFKVPLFRCKWFKLTGGGVKVDQQYGMTMVDFNNLGYLDEPFVLAKDVAQVFYVKDMSSKPRKRKDKKTISTSCDDPKRHIVLSGKRNIVGVEDKTDMSEDYNMFGEIPPFKVNTDPSIKLNDEDAPWIRHNRKQAGTQGKK
ncbi:hypothetical protein QYE76_036809 [Lolium multiflorum]|uniref:Transposase n=1 Tax=Lolium multiflorum TaxID=4521 RepID=A0AAD8R365_LOLMU|nr:hypothetical protein QYE76_036809 [Lolium multiflorum]